MAGQSSFKASDVQLAELRELSKSDDRGKADQACTILLAMEGWTSPAISAVVCVREDTVSFRCSTFAKGGVEAIKARHRSGNDAGENRSHSARR